MKRQDASTTATPSHDDREFVSVREAARLAGLGRTSVYKLLASGELASRRVGRRRLVVRRSLAGIGRS